MSVADRNQACHKLHQLILDRTGREKDLERAMVLALHQGKGNDIWLIMEYVDGAAPAPASGGRASAGSTKEAEDLSRRARELSGNKAEAGADIADELSRKIADAMNGGCNHV